MPHKASGWAGIDYATEAKQNFPALAGWWLKLVYTLVRYDPALPKTRNRFCRCAEDYGLVSTRFTVSLQGLSLLIARHS